MATEESAKFGYNAKIEFQFFPQALQEFLIASLNATAMGRVALYDRVVL